MFGAIIGDIVGSRFEFNNHRSKDFDLFAEGCFATDDSYMTLAVAKAILSCDGNWDNLGDETVKFMQEIGRKHPDCGFGGMFNRWIHSDEPKPYNSFGNGAAMRVAIYLYELEAEYGDGNTVIHRGAFDHAHMPEKSFLMFIETVRVIVSAFGFGGIVGLSGFMCALKKGEVKYCGVEFSDGGKLYHYRTSDLRIGEGNSVIVPVGESNYEREAVVKTVEFCRWDNTPYPLEKTKEIIRMADDEYDDITPPALLGEVITSEEDEDY
jgi:hypothetical protein